MREPMRRPPVSTVLLSGKYALSLTGEQEQQEKERIHTAETLLFLLFSCLKTMMREPKRRPPVSPVLLSKKNIRDSEVYSPFARPPVSTVLLSKKHRRLGGLLSTHEASCLYCSPV